MSQKALFLSQSHKVSRSFPCQNQKNTDRESARFGQHAPTVCCIEREPNNRQ